MKKCQEVCGEQAGSHPRRGEQNRPQWGRDRAMGTLQTRRTTGHNHTLFCFGRARKYIHRQKNYKVFGTSHFLHCWEQSFMWFKTAFSFPVRVAGDCYQAGSKTLPDCPLPPAKCCGSSRWPLNSATRPQDTQQNLFFPDSPPYSSRRNKEQSPGNCCKIKISTPWTALAVLGSAEELVNCSGGSEISHTEPITHTHPVLTPKLLGMWGGNGTKPPC